MTATLAAAAAAAQVTQAAVAAAGDPAQIPTAVAASQAADPALSAQDMTVTGARETGRSAQALTRNAGRIVDAMQTQDIRKLHVHASPRRDTRCWRAFADIVLPDTLVERTAIYRRTGRVYREADGLSARIRWLAELQARSNASARSPRKLPVTAGRSRSAPEPM